MHYNSPKFTPNKSKFIQIQRIHLLRGVNNTATLWLIACKYFTQCLTSCTFSWRGIQLKLVKRKHCLYICTLIEEQCNKTLVSASPQRKVVSLWNIALNLVPSHQQFSNGHDKFVCNTKPICWISTLRAQTWFKLFQKRYRKILSL